VTRKLNVRIQDLKRKKHEGDFQKLVLRFWRIVKIFREHVSNSDLEGVRKIVSKKGKLTGINETGEWRILTTINGIEENKAKEIIKCFGDFNGLISAEQSEISELLSEELSEKLYNDVVLKWRSEFSSQ